MLKIYVTSNTRGETKDQRIRYHTVPVAWSWCASLVTSGMQLNLLFCFLPKNCGAFGSEFGFGKWMCSFLHLHSKKNAVFFRSFWHNFWNSLGLTQPRKMFRKSIDQSSKFCYHPVAINCRVKFMRCGDATNKLAHQLKAEGGGKSLNMWANPTPLREEAHTRRPTATSAAKCCCPCGESECLQ